MIYKFMTIVPEERSIIEFKEVNGVLNIYTCVDELNPTDECVFIEIDKEQLFELIGGLLRIQAKMKGGKSNG
jgi:hypothetical protein